MKYLLLAAFAFSFSTVDAQQLQTSSFYDLQGMLQNPSMVGTQEHNFIGVTYATQWEGLPGGPKTATVFGSFDIPKKKIGVGGFVYSDKTGPTSRTGVVLSLAKHIVMNNGDKFSLGLENRLQQFSMDLDKFTTFGLDPVVSGGDNKMAYDAGFGISYTNRKFQVGASVSQLVQGKLDFYTGNLTRSEEARLYRHYYFHGAYNWVIDDVTTITPNFVYTYLPNAPSEFQIGARVDHKNHLWYGVGYRNKQNFMLSAGVTLKEKFVIGYAYDDYIAPISAFNEGGSGHTFLLKYLFGK